VTAKRTAGMKMGNAAPVADTATGPVDTGYLQ
jgi:hypothetical protein